MPTLQELIHTRKGHRSLQGVADDAGLAKQTVATHARTPDDSGRRLPDQETLLGLAKGLNVDGTEIMLAVGETMGVVPPNRTRPPILSQLPPWEVLSQLTQPQIDAVVQFICLLAEERADAAARFGNHTSRQESSVAAGATEAAEAATG